MIWKAPWKSNRNDRKVTVCAGERKTGRSDAGSPPLPSGGLVATTTYRLRREVGSGGMGTVYLADQFGVEGFVKTVAIKILRPELSTNEQFVSMFIGEARLAAGLVHQNIMQIYQLGKCESGFFIAMEYIDGIDLEQFVTRHHELGRKIPVELAVYVASRICRGLEYAHNKRDENGEPLDIVHRDVSPRNIMISNDGEVKLADFGVATARRYATDKLRDNVMVGKVEYMSPEQASYKRTDPRSDIFSLGVVFHEMLTASRIFFRNTEDESIREIIEGPTPDPRDQRPDLPEEVAKIVIRCLQRDPAARYQTAGEIGYDLEYHMYSGGYGPTIVTLAKYAADLFPDRKFYVAPSRGDNMNDSDLNR